MTSVSNTNLLGNWWETDVAKNILEKKYYHNGEDFNTFIDRVSGAFRDDVTKASLKEAMISGDFMPGGSILSGIGVKDRKISLNNCYVMPSPKDELASIFDVGKEMGIIFSRRGGCGVNLSKLRPKGARVHNSAITSTGAVSFVQYYDNMASTIGAEGRRAALLVALKATHPDIADFLKLKANDTSIQMANLSVIFNDDFMGSVYAGDMYTLHFKVEDTGEEIKKEIDARKLFMEFCELNRRFAEPGAIFIDTVRDYNMLSAYPKEEYLIECCNPCAEYYGAEYNACCLGSINLFNCVENPCTGNATFDFGKLRYLTSLGVRVLDEVLDIGYDAQPLDAHRKAIKDWRAIGLGVMGMADMLVAMGFEYGSKEANKFLEDVFREIRDMSLIESSCLAKSFGSFGNFDSEKVLASRFFHTVPDRIKGMIKKYGLRNGNLMSIAPSGTISTMIGVSNGVEPYFKVSYTRSTHTNVNEGTGKTFEVFAKAVELLMKKQNIKSHSELPDYIVDTYQINPFDRVITQGRIQEYVDNAISSTVNVKESTTTEEIFAIYMKAWTEGCKGLTIFRENCERTSIIDNKEGKKNTAPSPSLSKELVPEKRSGIKKLNGCTIVESTSCVPKMYVTINQKDGKPFEVFTASDSGCKSNIATITRMTSAMLRLGVPVDYVVKQLRQSSCLACQTLRKQGKEISLSCGNAIADAIEESLKPEAKKRKPAEEKIGMAKCPECGEYSLVPTGKCVYCPQCGYSRC